MGPLSGLKVVDLTHVMAGPTCTLMLADMGAEVIKIEKIPAGDDTRYMVPPKIGDEAASFLMMNRNKKGIALDLKTPGGAKVLRRLIGSADVLVENFGPGVMDRLGFGYAVIGPLFLTTIVWFKAVNIVGAARASLFNNLDASSTNLM